MTKIKKWPWEGDSPTVKARKMALAYRHAAEQQQQAVAALLDLLTNRIDRRLIGYHDPTILKDIDDAIAGTPGNGVVADLDQRFKDWGETWHCPKPEHYDDDDYVDAETAAGILQYARGTLLRYRVLGKIDGVWNPHYGTTGAFMFRVGDLHAFAAARRPRGHNLSDARTAGQENNPTDNITDSRSSDRE